jgi:hypothetical protein
VKCYRTVLPICAIPCVAVSSLSADHIVDVDWLVRKSVVGEVSSENTNTGPLSVTMSYDNWTPPELGGNTNLSGTLDSGGEEYGDDVALLRGSGGLVDSVAYSIVNRSSTGTLRENRTELRWYDSNAQLLGSFRFLFVWSNPVAPNSGRLIRQAPGFIQFLNITIPDDGFFSVRHFDAVGINDSDLGMRFGGPNTLGSSSRSVRNFTTGQSIDLGQGNNLGLFIRTVPIPAPAPAALGIIFGLGFGLRRRRGLSGAR